MNADQILNEIREANLSYLMLAQSLIRADREQALFRLGISEESAALIALLTPAQMMKIASGNTLLCKFRMMAQDFHDLTGQVVAKVVSLASELEDSLVKLLVQAAPPEQAQKVESSVLAGPVVSYEGRTDVVANQGEVDDLLASLGF